MEWDGQVALSFCRVGRVLISQGKESATERIPPCGIGVAAIPQGKGERAR